MRNILKPRIVILFSLMLASRETYAQFEMSHYEFGKSLEEMRKLLGTPMSESTFTSKEGNYVCDFYQFTTKKYTTLRFFYTGTDKNALIYSYTYYFDMYQYKKEIIDYYKNNTKYIQAPFKVKLDGNEVEAYAFYNYSENLFPRVIIDTKLAQVSIEFQFN